MDDYHESATVCSICVEISFAIHSKCDVGAGSDPLISLPPAVNLSLPSTIQPPSLELKPLPEHLKYAYLDDAQKLPVIACRKTITLTPPFPPPTSRHCLPPNLHTKKNIVIRAESSRSSSRIRWRKLPQSFLL